jgi:hypothetical protein
MQGQPIRGAAHAVRTELMLIDRFFGPSDSIHRRGTGLSTVLGVFFGWFPVLLMNRWIMDGP